MIIGEIRRYLRDNTPMRVSRSLRDIAKVLQVGISWLIKIQGNRLWRIAAELTVSRKRSPGA